MTDLETASHPENLRRVAIDPLSRVEGHGKVTLLLDADNRVQQARLHIVEFRGFEKFIQGRPYWEVPVMVQRLCGICPVSHHLAAAKAMDQIVGATLTPTAEKIRRLMHYGQILQSHALHFFHLASPDLLFGFDADAARRNIAGLVAHDPAIIRKGVLLRKYGQEIIRMTAGKRVHGTGAIPGGVNKALAADERALLLRDIYDMIAWSREAIQLVRQLFERNLAQYRDFGRFDAHTLSLVRADGALDFYDGGLRARRVDGTTLFDHFDTDHYWDAIVEDVKPWSYMKFPFLRMLGSADAGWYRVGPLTRVTQCDFIPTPFAERERQDAPPARVDHRVTQIAAPLPGVPPPTPRPRWGWRCRPCRKPEQGSLLYLAIPPAAGGKTETVHKRSGCPPADVRRVGVFIRRTVWPSCSFVRNVANEEK